LRAGGQLVKDELGISLDKADDSILGLAAKVGGTVLALTLAMILVVQAICHASVPVPAMETCAFQGT